MQITHFFENISIKLDNVCQLCVTGGATAKKKITDYAQNKFKQFEETWVWKNYAKPIYERNVQPLKKIDYFVLTGSLASAIILIQLTVRIFTTGSLPLAAGMGALIVMGAYEFSRHRIQKHFNEIAWEKIDQMRNIAFKMTSKNHKFNEIKPLETYLTRTEFKHLEADMKTLNKEISEFRTAILTLNKPGDESNFDDSKKTFTGYLEGLQQKLAPHKEIAPFETSLDGSDTASDNDSVVFEEEEV